MTSAMQALARLLGDFNAQKPLMNTFELLNSIKETKLRIFGMLLIYKVFFKTSKKTTLSSNQGWNGVPCASFQVCSALVIFNKVRPLKLMG
jgi:hypothetical protein